jgi:hypothetical protein
VGLISECWDFLPRLLGLAGTLLSIYLTADVAPRSLRQLKALRSRILLQEATLQIKPHIFITTFPNILLVRPGRGRADG